MLISISSDGRLVQWEITKGLETSQLMQLKRLARSTPGAAAQAAAAAAAAAVGGAGGSAGSKAIEKAAERAAEGRDPLISRHTGGMSFAFSPEDCRVYLAGGWRAVEWGLGGGWAGSGNDRLEARAHWG